MTEHVYRLREQMKIESNDGEHDCILIDAHTGAMCTCNASATILLEILQDGAKEEELEAALVQSFGVPAQSAKQDTKTFLQSLSAMGAMELGPRRSTAA